jgi:hypothetical protein
MTATKAKKKLAKKPVGFKVGPLKLNPTKTRSGAPITFGMVPVKERR